MFSRRPLKNSLQTRGASLSFTASKTPSKRLLACPHLLFGAGFKTTPPTKFQGVSTWRQALLGISTSNSKWEFRHLDNLEKKRLAFPYNSVLKTTQSKVSFARRHSP